MRNTHYYDRHARFENDHLIVKSFPEDEVVPHTSKKLVLELRTFDLGYRGASRYQHYYASLTCKIGDNQTVTIDMQLELTEAMRKTDPVGSEGYQTGDFTSHFIGKKEAIDAATEWFSNVFPDGSGWVLVIAEWVYAHSDEIGDYKDRVERVLVSKGSTG